jgi:hypothetical protein
VDFSLCSQIKINDALIQSFQSLSKTSKIPRSSTQLGLKQNGIEPKGDGGVNSRVIGL